MEIIGPRLINKLANYDPSIFTETVIVIIIIIFVMGETGALVEFVISPIKEFKDRLKRKADDNFIRVSKKSLRVASCQS